MAFLFSLSARHWTKGGKGSAWSGYGEVGQLVQREQSTVCEALSILGMRADPCWRQHAVCSRGLSPDNNRDRSVSPTCGFNSENGRKVPPQKAGSNC